MGNKLTLAQISAITIGDLIGIAASSFAGTATEAEPAKTEKAEKPAKKAKAEKKPAKKAAKKVTKAAITKLLKEAKAEEADEAKSALSVFDAKKISDVDEDDYSALAELLQKVIDGEYEEPEEEEEEEEEEEGEEEEEQDDEEVNAETLTALINEGLEDDDTAKEVTAAIKGYKLKPSKKNNEVTEKAVAKLDDDDIEECYTAVLDIVEPEDD